MDSYGLVGGVTGAARLGDTRIGDQMQATTVAPKHVPELAQQLHNSASHIAELNQRLSSVLIRLYGARPEPSNGQKEQPEPCGALLIAAFGAERIRQQIATLQDQISRLEEIA